MLRSALATLALLTAVAAAATAQQSDRRKGLWLGLGLGQAWGESTCSICLGQESGPALDAGLGGTMSQRLLAGVEATGWVRRTSQADRSFLLVTAVGTFYPAPGQGLHLKAGIGGYWYVEQDALYELTTQGLAVQLGAGYDIPITPGLSLSPFATWATSGFGNPTRLDKASGFKLPLLSDMTVRFFHFGLGVTIH